MPALLAVAALGLMAYLPGRLLLRLLVADRAAPREGRLLLELLLGNAAVGLTGFALAEAGVFSLASLLAGLAGLSVLAYALGRGRRAPALAGLDAAGLALAAAALFWITPSFDTALWGNDSSVYVAGGLSLARHGTLAFPDPTLAEMTRDERASFFPPYGRAPDAPPFIRVAGGLLLTDLDHGVVLPAFHHLLSVWVAAAWTLAGDGALAAPAAYFGALAFWSVAAFAFRLGGGVTALFAALLLAASVPEYWYARFLMPEVPSQYFLWSGLVAAAASLGPARGLLGVAAGLGLGMSGMMRVDGLAHLVAALALYKVVAPAGAWPAGAGFLPSLGGVALWTAAHQVLFPTHYYGEMVQAFEHGWRRLRGTFAGATGFGAGIGAQALLRGTAGAVFLAYAVATILSTRPDFATSLGWMTSYVGWPALLAGIAGGVLWWRVADSAALRFALLLGGVVLAQLFYDPRVTPAALWAVRRFVPVAIPTLLVGAALVASALWRRHRLAGGLALALLLAGTGSRNVFGYRETAFHQSIEHVRALVAQLPEDAVVAVDPSLGVQTQVHIALWSAGGQPTYLLGAGMRRPLLRLQQVVDGRPLYWLGGDDQGSLEEIASIADLVASYRFAAGVRRLDWYDARDELRLRRQTFWLYRLRPGLADEMTTPGALH